ncbi:hypothetical protein Tco_0315985 [Tanacetum coccineum]
MELENTQNNALAMLPMLKLVEYEMWEIRIKQYFQIQDYALWEVIENGNSWVSIPVTTPSENGTSTTTKMIVPSTIEEKTCKKNDSMFAAIKARFGGNEATKKTQKALLKQHGIWHYSHEGKEVLSDELDRNLIDWKAILLDMKIKGECFNCHKNGTFSQAMDAIDGDLDLIGVTWQRKKFRQTWLSWHSQILREHEVLFSEEIALLKRSVGSKEYQMGLLRAELEKVKQEKEGFEFKIAKFDKSAKDLEQLLGSQITNKSKKGLVYKCLLFPSPHPLILNRPTTLDLSYSGLEEFKEPEVNEYGPRDSSLKPTIDCDKESDNSKENTDDSLEQHQITDSETSPVMFSLKVDKDWKEKFFYLVNHVRKVEPKKDWVSDDEDDDEPNPKVEKKTVIPTATKKEFVKPEKPVKRSVSLLWDVFVKFTTLSNQQRKRIVSGNNYNKKDNDYYSKTSHSSAHKHMAPRAVLMKTGLKSVNTARPVNTVRSVNTSRPFSTARPFRSTVNTVRARGFNVVKPSACWVWRPIKPNGASLSNSQLNDKGFVDSGCSRHMTGNIAHLSDFKDFDGGYVTFGGGAYGGRITGKDNLGKFDGTSGEENKPMIEGNGPKWLFDLDSLTQSMNYVPVVVGTFSNDFAGIQRVSESSTSSQQDQDNQDCIVMPIWKDVSYFGDAAPRTVTDAQIEDKDELHDENDATEKSHDDSSLKDNGTADQQVNTARPEINTGSREVSTALPEVNTATPEDLVGPSPASKDTQVEDQEIKLGNIPQSYAVPTTPHTRIHQDHPIEHVIGDVQSSVQTRRMTTSYSELGFLYF